MGDSTESYVEILDGSRVHPETYEWARKMAVDALEYDDEDANPAGAVEEILESPDRLKVIDSFKARCILFDEAYCIFRILI